MGPHKSNMALTMFNMHNSLFPSEAGFGGFQEFRRMDRLMEQMDRQRAEFLQDMDTEPAAPEQVNCIKVRENDTECVSASNDGSCIIYNLQVYKRAASLQASTFFKSILYHPDESQILTAGTDRKVTYRDPLDGSAIRVLDASEDELHDVAITAEGDLFVTGGADKLVKVWHYDEGLRRFIGVGHSGSINRLAISPDQGICVSVGAEGAICIWALGVEAEA